MTNEELALLTEIRDSLKSLVQTSKEIRDTNQEIVSLILSDKKRYFTEEEAAAYLNVKVSFIKTLMYCPRGSDKGPQISFYMASNNHKYIDRDELDKFITRVRFKSEEEIQADRAEMKANKKLLQSQG